VLASPDGLAIAPAPPEKWIASISRFQVPAKRNPDHLRAIVGAIRMPAAFATLHHEGKPAAFGMSVSERGMAEIGAVMVDEAMRGNGLGRALVVGLMAWAQDAGATTAYLQVDQTNAAAISLYRSLGYRVVYSYETLVLKG
jgi:N-acetylglutamate synthase